MPKTKNPYKDRLSALRTAIKSHGVDGFIVPKADEYQGEYAAAYAERLGWLTGFTGSAGQAIVLADKAVVLTDGRYTIQVAQQVDAALFETGNSVKISTGQWLIDHAKGGDIIGYDPWLHTPEQIRKIEETLENKNIQLKALERNPIDEIWKDRPAPPVAKVEIFPEKFAGLSTADKRAQIAAKLSAAKIHAAILTLPDSIAWLLNIRGGDLDYVPVVLSYAIINDKGLVTWFVAAEKIVPEIRKYLGNAVEIKDPSEIEKYIDSLAAQAKKSGHMLGLDFKRGSVWFKRRIEMQSARIKDFKDPCIAPKACKTPAEQAAIKAAHIRDGVALAGFLAWLEGEAPKGKLTEISVAQKLEEFRRKDSSYRGSSFPTIAGFGPNGAIVHYRASEDSNAVIVPPGLLLLDSGGQYSSGTTDITRTIAIGKPSEEMRRNFTLVLKGHIAVARAQFPEGTVGSQIDALARQPLWQEGLDYAHGTGHGVGCFLSVHEEAASLSSRGQEALKPGMLLSNEPGYYKEGEYGIRIENLVMVQAPDDSGMLHFETISLAPIDRRLIVKDMLTPDELQWLNAYHQTMYKALEALVDKTTRVWLQAQTTPL